MLWASEIVSRLVWASSEGGVRYVAALCAVGLQLAILYAWCSTKVKGR